jgi:hypothetical protein
MVASMSTAPIPKVSIPLRPDPAAVRRAGVNALIRTATAHLAALVEGERPEKIVARNWPNDRDTGLLIKGAVAPLTMGDAAALAHLTTHLVTALSGTWAAPAVFGQGLQLSFDGATMISVPGFVADASKAGFVKEGSPIPVRSRLVTPCSLTPYHLKTISTLTQEMVTGSNAQAMVEDVIKQDVGLAFDSAAFDANPAVAETRPAGLRHGIAASTASNSTNPTDATLADIATVAGVVAAVAGNSPIILVASPVRAMMLKLRAPHGMPVNVGVLSSSAIAAGDLICIAPVAIVSAVDSAPEISASFEAVLHQDDAPTNISGASPVASMYQTGALALKCRMQASWSRRDDRAVAWLTATGW